LGLNAPPPSFYERFSSCASVAQRSDGLRPVETQEPAIASQTADTGNTADDPYAGSTSINVLGTWRIPCNMIEEKIALIGENDVDVFSGVICLQKQLA